MVEVFIALGSNVGDRRHNLENAIGSIGDFVDVTDISGIYETAPKYVEEQPRFLNMVIGGVTSFGALALLEKLKELEVFLGRIPAERYGPRLIDLDIIFYGNECINLPDLIVPHPALAEREFVLRPLADITSTKCHPVSGTTIFQMLSAIETVGNIRRIC